MTGFNDAADDLEIIADQLEDEIEEAVSDTADDIQNSAKQNIQNGTFVTGSLSRGIITRKNDVDNGASYSIVSTADHAAYVEFGTGIYNTSSSPLFKFSAPENMPRLPIVDWIREKGIQPQQYDTTFGLAEAIAQNIEEVGTPRQPYLRPAYLKNREQFKERLRAAVNKAINSA